MALISFYKMIDDGPAPTRADRSALGTIPARGLRYCEAVCTASALGYYIYPPIDVDIKWDGVDATWSFDGGNRWHPLRASQFPDFRQKFDNAAPEDCQGFSPPFISIGQTPGTVQIWSGLIVRTAPDWSLLVRQPANLVKSEGYMTLEGIIETDRWFGPLFTNIQLLRTDIILRFTSEQPFMQVQPIHRTHYDDRHLNDYDIHTGLAALSDVEWSAYHRTIVVPNLDPEHELGGYAIGVRKRRAHDQAAGCPILHRSSK